MERIESQMLAIDSAILSPIIRKATGREDLRGERWQTQMVTGEGASAGERVPWTVIMKVIRPSPNITSGAQVSHIRRREPLYYQTGILANLPAELRASRCFGVFERPDGAVELLRKAWSALDRLPQASCCQDAFCRNLFAECAPASRDQLIAVAWSYIRPAQAVGRRHRARAGVTERVDRPGEVESSHPAAGVTRQSCLPIHTDSLRRTFK